MINGIEILYVLPFFRAHPSSIYSSGSSQFHSIQISIRFNRVTMTLIRHCTVPIIIPPSFHPSIRTLLQSSIDLNIPNPQHRISVLALHRLRSSRPLLLLELKSHWLTGHLHHARLALEKLFINVWVPLHRKFPRSQHTGMSDTDGVPNIDILEEEWETDSVAGGDEEREAVDLDGDIVGWLEGKTCKKLENRGIG